MNGQDVFITSASFIIAVTWILGLSVVQYASLHGSGTLGCVDYVAPPWGSDHACGSMCLHKVACT